MYPQGREGYPPPSASPIGFASPSHLPYSIYPGTPSLPTGGPSMGYQPGPGVGSYSPIHSSNPSPYLPGLGASPYPLASTSHPSIYPPVPGTSPSPYQQGPSLNTCSYPPGPSTGLFLYPSGLDTGPSPYPPGLGLHTSPYPSGPSISQSTYLPASGTSSSPYPQGPGINTSPYPPGPSTGPGINTSPYPPGPSTGPSPYPSGPSVSQSLYPPIPGGGPSHPSGPCTSSSPYSPAPGTSPSGYPPNTASSSFPYPPASGNTPYSSASSSSLYSPPQNYSNTFHSSSSSQQNLNFSQHHPSAGSRAGKMWPYEERATVRPNVSFDPSSDASVLRKAMKGFGTDEAAIIRVLGRRTNLERQQIIPKYQQAYGKDLIKDLRSELSGNFLRVVESLLVPMPEFLARELHDAIAGIGTNETTLIEILCSGDNNTLRNIKSSYQIFYRKPLETDLKGDTSGYFLRLMVAMAAASRDEMSNTSLAPSLAQSLYAAGVKKLGTDEAEFIRILSSYSYPLLRCVFQEYSKISGGKSFESAIKSELSGDLCRGMLALYECINNRAAFFARQLHEAMRGLGTDDRHLIRIVTWRAEIDMANIKNEFHVKYGKKLENAIASETSSDYKKILLALIQD